MEENQQKTPAAPSSEKSSNPPPVDQSHMSEDITSPEPSVSKNDNSGSLSDAEPPTPPKAPVAPADLKKEDSSVNMGTEDIAAPPPVKAMENSLGSSSDLVNSVSKASERSVPKKTTGIIIGIIIFIILVATFAVMGYLFYKNSNHGEVSRPSIEENKSSGEFSEKEDVNSSEEPEECETFREEVRKDSGNITDEEIDVMLRDAEELVLRTDKVLKKIVQQQVETKTGQEREEVMKEMETTFSPYGVQERACGVALNTYYLKKNLSEYEDMGTEEKEIYVKEQAGKYESGGFVAESIDEAKQKNQIARAKSEIAFTLPSLILCMDDNAYLTKPQEGKEVCQNGREEYGVWSDINRYGAKWGGCEMEVVRENGRAIGFKYCAVLPDETLAVCKETGCEFGLKKEESSEVSEIRIETKNTVSSTNSEDGGDVSIGTVTY